VLLPIEGYKDDYCSIAMRGETIYIVAPSHNTTTTSHFRKQDPSQKKNKYQGKKNIKKEKPNQQKKILQHPEYVFPISHQKGKPCKHSVISVGPFLIPTFRLRKEDPGVKKNAITIK
jgi:hypothetical protein